MIFPGLIVIVQLSLIEYSQSQYSEHSALLFLALAFLGIL